MKSEGFRVRAEEPLDSADLRLGALFVLQEMLEETARRGSPEYRTVKEMIAHEVFRRGAGRRRSIAEFSDELFDEFRRCIADSVDDRYDGTAWERESWKLETEQALRGAVENCSCVSLRYNSDTSGVTNRQIDPYAVRLPYVRGYCHLRKEVRTFHLGRILKLSINDQKFQRPADWRWDDEC